MKYKLLINKETGERSVRDNTTGEVYSEFAQRELYNIKRARAIRNLREKGKNIALESLGLKKVKGALGGTYWE
jgi:hypothetical protein